MSLWRFLLFSSFLSGVGIFFGGCLDQRDAPSGVVLRPLNASEKQEVEAILLKAAPRPRVILNATLTEPGQAAAVLLYGADIQPWPLRRGEDAQITIYYKALRSMETLWRPFLHLQGARYSRHFHNLDQRAERAVGLYHSKRWQSGQFFRYTFKTTLPADFSAAQAFLYTGFWSGDLRMKNDARTPSDGQNRILLATIPVTGKELTRPLYVAYRTSKPPTIDGHLNDAVWQKAPSTGRFRTYNNRRARFRTEARMAWDDRYLYASFDMEDNDIYSTFTKRDDPLFKQEVVEFFIDANRNRADYIELQVSPAGVIFDSFFKSYRFPKPWGDLSYDSGMDVRVQVRGTLNKRNDRDQGWSVEMRLPFSRLGPAVNLPPKDGDEWSINMYRLERSRHTGAEDHAWSPVTLGVGGDYHRLERFGTLRFSTRDLFAPSVAKITPTTPITMTPSTPLPPTATTKPATRTAPRFLRSPDHPPVPRLPAPPTMQLPSDMRIRMAPLPHQQQTKIYRLQDPNALKPVQPANPPKR